MDRIAKRRRFTAPCHCPLCKGKERDHRTIKSHQALLPTHFSGSTPDSLSGESAESTFIHDDNFSSESQIHDSFRMETEEESEPPAEKDAQKRIHEFIVREMNINLVRGHSRATLEEHLANVAKLMGDNSIPVKWSEVIKMLKSLGYKDPKHFKVCVTPTHSQLLKNKRLMPQCPQCYKNWDECIDYYCLGLNIDEWFLTDENCKRLMSHWYDKDTWFKRPHTLVSDRQTELWHGTRFRELSYFWDKSAKSLLPERCPSCSKIVSAQVISRCLTKQSSEYEEAEVACPHCNEFFSFSPQYMFGDPRNQAILIHEDGWNPHIHWGHHSIATITVTHGCMSKAERSDGSYARVYSFIPVHQLPRSAPHKFDAFFEPLIEEIEDAYMNGVEVFFKMSVDQSHVNDVTTVRVLPLLITADSKAHAEIGLTTAGGYRGCRRCFLSGQYISEKRHYYYGQFRKRYRFPAPARSAESNRQYGQSVDSATSSAEKQRRVKETGVTGETIFYRFYDLCGFDPIHDLVIDVMHALLLNLVRSEMEHHLLGDLGQNSTLPVTDRSPAQGRLLSKREFASSLSALNWTVEMKDGRVPTVSQSGDCCSGWTAEEFSKFILVAPVVLRGLIPQRAYESIFLLHRIYCLIFSKQLRIQGWFNEHTDMLNALLWRHAILYEELYGLSACTENVEYSLHMTDDIRRHGPLDNYWCFMYERKVKYYKRQTTNNKSMCKTFAEREARLQFTLGYLSTNCISPISQEFDLSALKKEPVLLRASSFEEAVRLKEFIENVGDETLANCLMSGILLGAGKHVALTKQQQEDIAYWLRKEKVPFSVITNTCLSFSRILKVLDFGVATVFRKGENAVLDDAAVRNREWVIQIKDLFVYGPVGGKYFTFVNGIYYVAKQSNQRVDFDEWTKQPKLVFKHFQKLCLQPTSLLNRKIILYKNQLGNASYFLSVDIDQPITIDIPKIPHFPVDREVVETTTSKLILVCGTDDEGKLKGNELTRIGRENVRYKINNLVTFHVSDVVCNHLYTMNAGCVYIK